MQKGIWIGAFVAGLLAAAWISPRQWNGAFAQQTPANHSDAGRYLALSAATGQGGQQVTVIDTQTRAMSVYHIEYATGVITLKAVRNIEADFLMDEFNTESPLPREIRAMLNNQR